MASFWHLYNTVLYVLLDYMEKAKPSHTNNICFVFFLVKGDEYLPDGPCPSPWFPDHVQSQTGLR